MAAAAETANPESSIPDLLRPVRVELKGAPFQSPTLKQEQKIKKLIKDNKADKYLEGSVPEYEFPEGLFGQAQGGTLGATLVDPDTDEDISNLNDLIQPNPAFGVCVSEDSYEPYFGEMFFLAYQRDHGDEKYLKYAEVIVGIRHLTHVLFDAADNRKNEEFGPIGRMLIFSIILPDGVEKIYDFDGFIDLIQESYAEGRVMDDPSSGTPLNLCYISLWYNIPITSNETSIPGGARSKKRKKSKRIRRRSKRRKSR